MSSEGFRKNLTLAPVTRGEQFVNSSGVAFWISMRAQQAVTEMQMADVYVDREADYQRILGPLYKHLIRSMMTDRPGTLLLSVDYLGAELLGMAIMSGDETMIDHALRAALPEDDPNFYDIHSNVAVMAFRLNCPPTKKGLKNIGKAHLRVAAKSIPCILEHNWPIRTIICASPGHLLVEADFAGAELLGMALMSGDPVMIAHAQRASLPENHPNYYDIHSNVTVLAFNLTCPPTKSGLTSAGKAHLRSIRECA